MLSAQALEAQGVPKEIAKAMAAVVNPPAQPAAPSQPAAPAPQAPVGTSSPSAGLGGQHTGVSVGGTTTTLPSVQAASSGGGGSGGSGSGGGSTTPPPPPPLDWKAYLADWGFTPDIINELTSIFKTYTDPSQAQAAALAYIRGTDWYSKTFPGIQTGEKLGLFGDEQGYRSYVNNVNGLYQNYYGRNVTTNELLDYVNGGRNEAYVGNHLQGISLVNAQKPDIQYELGAFDTQGAPTDSELSQYGDYLGGIGNMIGPQLQERIRKAQQRMADIFQGTIANPSLSMASGKLVAPSLGNAAGVGASKAPDIPS